jgi:hypothetical protein
VPVRFRPGAPIFIGMACHCLHLRDSKEFFELLKRRDPDLISKMVRCVLSAAKRGKDKIDIFDITFKTMDELTFTIDKSQYKEMLSNCMEDMIAAEEYELCAEIKKILDKKSRTRKVVEAK